MRKVLIFGNSGSGKSTLAKKLVAGEGLAHLDLDSLAWGPGNPPERASLQESRGKIDDFVSSHAGWVIEGCYVDLLGMAAPAANEAIFMNLSIAQCIKNAEARPWEPHKYESKKAQDDNLKMLVDWIRQYEERSDVFSYHSHSEFFEAFAGKKSVYTQNESHT